MTNTAPTADRTITMRSDALEVTLTPERGADIVRLTDRATGVQTLAVSPTGDVTPAPFAASNFISGDSMVQWTNGYPGGWQLMVPNAGPERVHDGVAQGYHGEASLARWTVLEQSATSVTLTTSLFTAPLRIERTVSLDGALLTVTDTVTNLSPEPCSFRLGQHPAFGTPFLDERSYVVTSANTLITDANAPGTLTGADAVGRPDALLPAGPVPNSVALPGPGTGQALFGVLTDFEPDAAVRDPAVPDPAVPGPSGADRVGATFCSPTHGFGMRISWDRTVYPNAWFWIEANAGSGWPWFKRLFSIAVEPANVLPGEGVAANGRERGGLGTTLPGGASLVSTIRVDRLPLP